MKQYCSSGKIIKKLDLFIDNLVRYNTIYIYGAGEYGRLLGYSLMEHGKDPSGYIETKQTKDYCEGIKVYSVNHIPNTNLDDSVVVIAVRDRSLAMELKRNARTAGLKNTCVLPLEMIALLDRKSSLRKQMLYSPLDNIDFEGKNMLIIAPHPDDEVIGCGGLLSKYGSQFDILCVNSSGVKYEWNKVTAKEIAEERIMEFYEVANKIGARKSWIGKIWGIPPMFSGIEAFYREFIDRFDYDLYDYIFIPDLFDAHREHRFISNCIAPRILSDTTVKRDLKIACYEVWSAIGMPNYFFDISDRTQAKRELIEMYKSRINANYADRILGLNRYRGMASGCEYAEAFKIYTLDEFLELDFSREWRKP